MGDRRRGERHRSWLLVRLESPTRGEWLAMGRNLSRTGALVATASLLDVGHAVAVTFGVGQGEAPERTVSGTIVRAEPNAEDPGGLWPHRLALEFDEPVPELDTVLRADAEVGWAEYLEEIESGR